jgi:nitroreductase
MVELLEGIMTTRAMRRFTDEPVTDDEVRTCLRAAVQGPSGGNIQPWRFVVLTDPELRKRAAEVYRRAYDRYEPALMAALPPFRSPEDEASFHRSARASRHLADTLADVPVLVLVCIPRFDLTLTDAEGPLDVGTPYASVYPAVQNLMLAARALGIGTSLTTVFRIYHDEMREVCGIPDRYEVVALVPMGRPASAFRAGRRRPAEEVTSWDGWRK